MALVALSLDLPEPPVPLLWADSRADGRAPTGSFQNEVTITCAEVNITNVVKAISLHNELVNITVIMKAI